MPPKKSFDAVIDGFSREDYIVVSTSYESAIIPILMVCDKGHFMKMRWNDFQQGKRCKECYNERMMSLDKVITSFNAVGLSVVTAEYINNTLPLRFVCDNGHMGSLSWQNFRRGVRCVKCKEEAKLKKKYCSKCNNECVKLERGMCSRCYKTAYGSGYCSKCGKYAVLTKSTCPTCYGKFCRPRAECVFCSRKKIVHTRDDKGYPVCRSCYAKHITKKEECNLCGNTRVVQFREENGSPVCNVCYRKKHAPKKICFVCGKNRVVSKNTKDGPICKKCYAVNYKRCEICNICGKLKTVYTRNSEGFSCQSCYKKFLKKKEVCLHCGKIKYIVFRRDGLNLCSLCADKKRRAEDPAYRCLLLLRGRVRGAFSDYSKTGKIKSADEYGIDYEKIIEHLGSRPEGDFHIDHILPLSAFDFDDPVQIKAAFAPENHQWLTAKENLEKHNKYDPQEFKKYLEYFYNKKQ